MKLYCFIKKRIVKPVLRFLLIYPYLLFYDRKYYRSKWFDLDHFLLSYSWLHKCFFEQKILGINRKIRFPCSRNVDIASSEKIEFDIDDLQNFMVGYGNYYQNFSGNIKLGKNCYVAHNVALITANHNFYNLDEHYPPKDIIIGNNCWIGINSVILPGVILGDRTIIGAGSVVTKSFPDGMCVVAGNPAKIIKKLNQ